MTGRMVELIITDRLHLKIFADKTLPRLISMRPLTKKEIVLARKLGISRYYMPSLTETESAEFFKEFDNFWDQLISHFDHDHPFWRNAVSSKMQEWESSATYLAILIFTLAKRGEKDSARIVIVCSSLEEEYVCEEWGKKRGWKVYRRPYLLLPYEVRYIFQKIRNLKNFLYLFAICLCKKWLSPKYKPKKYLVNKKILIASLFYLSSFKNGKYIDPFFGNLHDVIRENEFSVTYLCNPLEKFRKSAMNTRECSNVSIVIPYSIITWIELIFLVLKVFVRRVQVTQTNFLGCDFSKLLRWNLHRSYEFFNLDAEIFYSAVSKLCMSEKYVRLIQLYEGNVFERACIQAFRKHSSGDIVGYSHAVIFPLNLKIHITDKEKQSRPEPDFFICTGPEGKRLMAQIGNRDTTMIRSGCSLRYIPVVDNTKPTQTSQSNILVALDGVKSSSIVLDWLIEHAEILKDYKIKLRAHPNVPLKGLLKQCLKNPPDNFCQSNGDLEADIKNSFCVLYRQTSVGMQALLNGVPAIYLDVDAPLISDPIMSLKACKWRIRTPEELLKAIQEIRSLDPDLKKELIKNARENAKDYFTFPNNENIMFFYADGILHKC